MSAADLRPSAAAPRRHARCGGASSVEFALIVIAFLTLVFGLLEVTRAMYLTNTLYEATRRAAELAANAGFDDNSLDQVRSKALFLDTNGKLVLGAPITPAHLRIDYFSIASDSAGVLTAQPVAPMPSCPARNKINCLADPNGASCIRLVRVRICQPDDADCTRVPYQSFFPLVKLTALRLPHAETIAPVQTLGYQFGAIPCP